MTQSLMLTTEGKFISVEFGRYRVFGDPLAVEHPTNFDEPCPFTVPSSSKSWVISRPWSAGVGPSL